MDVVKSEEIKPFVRFSRYLKSDIKRFALPTKAYDQRLLYCTDGFGKINIENVFYDVKAGTIALWRAAQSYYYVPDSINPMTFLAISFDYTYKCSDLSVPIPPASVQTFDAEKITENIEFSDVPVLSSPVMLENMQILYEKFIEIHSEFTYKKKFYATNCSGLLASILSVIANQVQSSVQNSKSALTVNRVVEYLNKNYQEEITNEKLGKLFGYHPNYLNLIFLKHTDKTLHQYLLNLRIMKAIHYLQDTDLPISEICSKTGFSDLTHFSKYFKEKTGCAPSRFRV